MSTIAFVGCVKRKKPGVHPAADKYTSPLFTKSRAYAEAHADRWFILSAKYGLLDPAAPIDDYDETLNEMSARERQRWAERVASQIGEARVVNAGDRVLWLAGRQYKDHLETLLTGAEHLDPMRGLGIGSRLGWLSRTNGEAATGTASAPVHTHAAPTPASAPVEMTRHALPTPCGTRGSKYDRLRARLATRREPRVTLSFAEIESILGFPLPASATQYQAWWANESDMSRHTHKRSWTDAGYRVESVILSRTSGMVTFERAR